MYYVIGQNGERYGPATLSRLSEWVAEGRLAPMTKLEDGATGRQLVASSLPDLVFPVAPPPVIGPKVAPAPDTPVPPGNSPDFKAAEDDSPPFLSTTRPYYMSPMWRARYDFVRQWFILLSLLTAFLLIGFGAFWAIKSGYEDYTANIERTDLIAANVNAATLLNRGNFQAAFPLLKTVLRNSPAGSALYVAAQHNLGTYWLEAGEAAQQRNDYRYALQCFTSALPLLPERSTEINQAIQSLRMVTQHAGTAKSTLVSQSGFGNPAPPVPVRPVIISSNRPNRGGVQHIQPPVDDVLQLRSDALNRSRDEYQAGLTALARNQTAEAMNHFGNAVSVDPGAPWVDDAQRRFVELSRQLNVPPGG